MDWALNPAGEPEAPTPEVRQDLTLYRAEADEEGAAVWHLHDPLANRYFQLEERDVEILALLGHGNAREVSDRANDILLAQTSNEEVEELVEFLRFNNLVIGDDHQKGHYQQVLANNKKQDWFTLLVRNPLFFRIPLTHPDKFLTRTLPYVRWLGSRYTAIAFVFLTLLGFYLASRQLDVFLGTFLHFFNFSGLVVYMLTLLFVKVLHELGHAYTAKAMGCRVPVIGVAFLVGWPVFYTDTSDAWKLANRKRRLLIGIAGVSVELAIASLSLLLWSVTPEGGLKSAFFLLATTTWIVSIVVNFNPFMRFDGYYILSDLLRVPNLEPRAFSMAKWWLRERLFGLGDEPPEPYRVAFVVHAFAVWLYRFFLFLGIALIVYEFFFRAAGIAMFVAELMFFIGKPIYNEVKVWWEMRDRIHMNAHVYKSLGVVVLILLVLFVPWRTDLSAPAILKGRVTDIYLPAAGQLHRVGATMGMNVPEGSVLFELVSPQLENEFDSVRHRHEELKWAQASLGFNERLRSQAMVIGSELRTQNQRLRSLFEKREQLVIKAPFAGTLVDVAPDMTLDDWLPAGFRIGTVVDAQDSRIVAYLEEDSLARVEAGMSARFYPETPEFGVIPVKVASIDFVGTGELDEISLASLFGGDIAVRETDAGGLAMVRSHYRIELLPEAPIQAAHVLRGTVIIDGHATSPFSQIRRQFVSVFIRETGF